SEGRNRGDNVPFTWFGHSNFANVESIKSTMTSARSRNIRLRLSTTDTPHDYISEMSAGNLAPADLTETARRAALYGDRKPLADQHLGFLAESPDPFRLIREARVPDEIVRPLAELLTVELLVGTGRATRVTEFKLGAAVRGFRHLVVGWEPPRRYSNQREVN